MCTNETVRCPHCGKPRLVQQDSSNTPEVIGPRLCGECRQTYLHEIADTLFAVLTSRLENGGRSRCSIGEQERDNLPSGTIFRRLLRVESLCHDQGRIVEAIFDYSFAQLCVGPSAQSGTKHVAFEASQFPLDDIRLNTIVRSIVRALALVHDVNDEDVGEEVRFGKQLANVKLFFQQPCQHIPPCSGF